MASAVEPFLRAEIVLEVSLTSNGVIWNPVALDLGPPVITATAGTAVQTEIVQVGVSEVAVAALVVRLETDGVADLVITIECPEPTGVAVIALRKSVKALLDRTDRFLRDSRPSVSHRD